MTNIANNKKAFFEYSLDDRFETGIVLEGWEVKALRAGKAQLTDGYVVIRNEEMFLIGLHITPLKSTSSHTTAVVDRTRKLLLKKEEITRLIGKVQQKGFTIIPLNLHWKGGLVKCDIALAKGKNTHDKRQSIKEREGRREVERVMKNERS